MNATPSPANGAPAPAGVNALKVVGTRRPPSTPAEFHARSWLLEREIDLLNPYSRPRGFVFKARTWREWEQWRRSGGNPRLW